jgi:hypothetical protein
MRDSNKNMIELLEASKENEAYFSLIKHEINGESLRLRFGIVPSDYGYLKQILEFRPFENTAVAPYRYFFALSYRKETDELSYIDIRVEQLRKHKQFEFKISNRYISNLLWFSTLTSKKEVELLIEK